MAGYCSNCGTALAAGARFCPACGRPAKGGGAAADPSSPARPASGLRAMVIGAGVVFAAAGLGAVAYYGLPGGGNEAADAGDDAAGNGSATAEKQRLYAVGEANLRDKPTAVGSRLLGKLQRGQVVEGVEETGADGNSRWLRIEGSGHYVSLANLSADERPALASTDGSDRVIRMACALLPRPAEGGEPISLAVGAAVKRVGTTPNGFVEYGLPQGGVGYSAPTGGCETDPSAVKGAVSNSLIKFDPKTCEFGPELKPYFDKAIAKRTEAESTEGATVTYPVDKIFHGLRVSHVLIGYEWHGLFFDAPAEKAREVFRKLGYRVDKDGDMTATGDDVVVGAMLFDSPAEERKLGLSQLTCGV